MGWEDRVYYQENRRPTSFFAGRSVTFWLMTLCIAAFVIDAIAGRMMGNIEPIGNGPLTIWGLYSASTILSGQVWRLITFQFLHSGLLHLVFNMFMLHFFGRIMEEYLGGMRYLMFYLLGGVAGAALYMLLWLLGTLVPGAERTPFLIQDHGSAPMVGASAGLFALMMAAAYHEPMRPVSLIIPPITLTLRILAYILVGISAFFVMVGGRNVGGEAAHLGGAIFGAVAIRFPGWMGLLDAIGKRIHGSLWEKKQAAAARERALRESQEAEVDRILDKVRANGLQSLSAKEKKILNRATERAKHDEPDFRRR